MNPTLVFAKAIKNIESQKMHEERHGKNPQIAVAQGPLPPFPGVPHGPKGRG